jgi:hypothetical protein
VVIHELIYTDLAIKIMKLEIIKHSSIFLATYYNLVINLVILKLFYKFLFQC